MDDVLFEQRALLNALKLSASCYAVAATEFSGSLAAFLTGRAQARQAHCALLAAEWVIEPAGPEPSDLDDAQRRARSGVAAFAELVATLEFAIVGILERDDERCDRRGPSRAPGLRQWSAQGQGSRRTIDRPFRPAEVKAPDASPAAERAHQFDVYFATNRTPIHVSEALVGFGSGRSEEIHHGRCEVTIPETHRIGSIGSPWWRRIGRGDDRLRLAALTPLEPSLFWQEVRGRINETVAPGDAIVFIHGFNVSFLEASLRAAQIGADLALDGVTTFFSWPSRGTVRDTRRTRRQSRPVSRRLRAISSNSPSGIWGPRYPYHRPQHGQSRAAPSRQSASPHPPQPWLGSRLGRSSWLRLMSTRYISRVGCSLSGRCGSHDPLCVQRRPGGKGIEIAARRVADGFAPPIAIVEGIDTVSAKNVDVTLLGHGYVASSRPVLVDIHDLIKHGSAPDDRATLRRRTGDTGQPFWEFAYLIEFCEEILWLSYRTGALALRPCFRCPSVRPAKARVTRLLDRPKIQSRTDPFRILRGLPRAAERPRSAQEGA